tara:strand:+ start:41 stop:250 length:210 start_codon:yes stop_codon:yes gene_type:complete
MTAPEHNPFWAVTGGFSNLLIDSNTTDFLTCSTTSLVMACTEALKKINIEKHNKNTRLNFSIFFPDLKI